MISTPALRQSAWHQPLQRLEALEASIAEVDPNNTGVGANNANRWLVPYADMMTLLLALFLLLYAGVCQQNQQLSQQIDRLKQQLQTVEPVNPQTFIAPVAGVSSAASATGSASASQALQNKLKQLPLLKTPQAQQAIEVQQTPQATVISLQEAVLFAPGEATLNWRAKQTLKQLAPVLLQQAQQQMQAASSSSSQRKKAIIDVEGHTDDTPIHSAQFASNWELSSARATAIVRFLTEQASLPAAMLSASGYGSYQPVANNSTIKGKQKNRRVAIVIRRGPVD